MVHPDLLALEVGSLWWRLYWQDSTSLKWWIFAAKEAVWLKRGRL